MSRSQRRGLLKTEADDLFYGEYIKRERLPPIPKTSDSQISMRSRGIRTASSMRSLKTSDSLRSISTVASVKQPSFKRDGYEQMNSRLGDDPLTAVKLMRSQMAQMSLRDRLNDRDVKFARAAGRTLLKAEYDLEQMQRLRTDAIINGDTLEARRINRMMQDIRSKATYDAYADLLLSEKELASYGVKSKYAPRPSRRPRTIENFSPRRSFTADTRRNLRTSSHETSTFNRYIHTPPNAVRSQSRRERRRPLTEDSLRPDQSRSQSNKRGRREKTKVKKNKRLADIKIPKPKTPPPKPPKTPPTDVPPTPENGEPGVCPQCYERNPALVSEEGLKQHWETFCSCLTSCQYCDQLMHVSDLNNHHVNNCEFVNGTLKPCPLCGLAQYLGNSNHPDCNLKPPPSGAAWCPLCSKPVKPFSSKAAWRKHLIDECYNNPRNLRRWTGRYAPSNGASLLGGLTGQVIAVPNAPATSKPQVAQNNLQTRPVQQPNKPQLNLPTQNNAGANQPAVQIASGPLNPNQLRLAYNKLREERREDYIKQQNLDAALDAEKEDEEV